jgi:glycine/D-amino acid oxidase-like deaminating enzyme
MNLAAGYDVLVAGAGVVGVACARALQRAGLRVCLTDPEPPGSGCSFGNAGVVATEHVLPLARLQTLLRLPAMLGRDGPLYLKPTRLPGLLPWFARFAGACRPGQVARGTRGIAALTARALPAWQRELAASGGRELLQTRGMYSVYRSERAFLGDARERELARRLGVRWELLDGAALREREPALNGALRHAVFYPDVAHVLSPHKTASCLAGAFVAAGGTLLDEAVTGITSRPHEVEATLRRRRVRSRYLVVAAGLASREVCGLLGWTPPLAAEMGYHLTFPGAGGLLDAPVAAAEDAFIATPMDDHLRVAGTVEFARREAPAAWHRAERLARQAAGLFAEPLPAPGDRWRGSRPSLPDFLPAIGPIPGHPRVIAAFGHQHIGLTTAAVTGELVRDMVRGETPEVDVAPYAPARFGAGVFTRGVRPRR